MHVAISAGVDARRIEALAQSVKWHSLPFMLRTLVGVAYDTYLAISGSNKSVRAIVNTIVAAIAAATVLGLHIFHTYCKERF